MCAKGRAMERVGISFRSSATQRLAGLGWLTTDAVHDPVGAGCSPSSGNGSVGVPWEQDVAGEEVGLRIDVGRLEAGS